MQALKLELVSEALAAASAKVVFNDTVSSLKAQLQNQVASHEGALTSQNVNAANLSNRVRDLVASLAAAQAQESDLKESLALATGGSSEATARAIALQKELTSAKATASVETAKSKELEDKLVAVNEAETSLKTQLAAQKMASEDALATHTATSDSLRKQVRELDAALAVAEDQEKLLQKSVDSLSDESKEIKTQMLTLQKEFAVALSTGATAAAKSGQERDQLVTRSSKLEAEVKVLAAKLASNAADRALAEAAAASAQSAAAKASVAVAAVRARAVAQTEELKGDLWKARAEAAQAWEEASTARRDAAATLAEAARKRGWFQRIGRQKAAAATPGGIGSPKVLRSRVIADPAAGRKQRRQEPLVVASRMLRLALLFVLSSLAVRAFI